MNATCRESSTMPITSTISSTPATSFSLPSASASPSFTSRASTVVARLNMAFKTPLTSGDEFISRLALRKEGIKYVFVQDIYRLPDLKPVIKSTVETVCVVNGRLSDSALFNEIFAPYLNQ